MARGSHHKHHTHKAPKHHHKKVKTTNLHGMKHHVQHHGMKAAARGDTGGRYGIRKLA